MKKMLQNFGNILSILFVDWQDFVIFLAEYAVHRLSTCYGLLTPLVLLNSVARWCDTTQFFTKMV